MSQENIRQISGDLQTNLVRIKLNSRANLLQIFCRTHANIVQIAGKSPKIFNIDNIISYASMYDPRTCFLMASLRL